MHFCYKWSGIKVSQGESAHRNPKASYLRTNKKGFEKQLAQIERRRARIRRFQEKFPADPSTKETLVSIDDRYEIGLNEKYPRYIPQFLNENIGDPAIKVCTFVIFQLFLLIHL